MKLRSQGEPARDAALDRLNDAVGALGRHFKAGGHLVERHVMHAVNAQLAVAIHPLHQ